VHAPLVLLEMAEECVSGLSGLHFSHTPGIVEIKANQSKLDDLCPLLTFDKDKIGEIQPCPSWPWKPGISGIEK